MQTATAAVYGKCQSKNFRITKDWKCVDFRINPKYTQQEQQEIMNTVRAQDWFDVCPWCRYFTPVP